MVSTFQFPHYNFSSLKRKRSPSRAPSPWNHLPADVLLAIADKLDVTSSVRLSAVCTSWASSLLPWRPSLPPYHLDKPTPWLLLSARNSPTSPDHTDLTFYDVTTTTFYTVPVNIPLSLSTHRWLGSSKGWLVTVDPQLRIHLIKPLTGTHLLLPSFDGIYKRQHKKVVLCHTTDDESLVVYCLIGQRCLAVTKVGDRRWTSINHGLYIQDIFLYGGKVYAVSWYTICCYDPHRCYIEPEHISSHAVMGWTKYLFEWKGELLFLLLLKDERIRSGNQSPKQVELYKVNTSDLVHPVKPVRNLGEDALFVSVNSSYVVSRSASGLDGIIRGNCIYFTAQVSSPCHDAQGSRKVYKFGAFDLGKRTYMPSCSHRSPLDLSAPIWFWPC